MKDAIRLCKKPHDLTKTTSIMRQNLTPSHFDHAFTSGTKQLKSLEITMRSIIPVFGNMFKFTSFLVVLAFILAALPAESESTTYEAPIVAFKLEGAAIGVNGSTVVVNGVTITFSNWIPKMGSPGKFVGFTIDKPGYTFTVKAGNELLSGIGTSWINPNGTLGTNVKAISNVNFCMNDGNPNDKALCYLIADNDGFGNNSPDGITFDFDHPSSEVLMTFPRFRGHKEKATFQN